MSKKREDFVIVKVFNIYVEFGETPNLDIYTPYVPEELVFTGQSVSEWDQSDVEEIVWDELAELITFDTPDAPYFEIDYVDFDWERKIIKKC